MENHQASSLFGAYLFTLMVAWKPITVNTIKSVTAAIQ